MQLINRLLKRCLLPRLCAIALLAFLAPVTRAQFFNPGTTSFEPQIDTINSGVLLDAQATVNSDLRYVTITARPVNSQLLALQSFPFQISGGGAATNVGAAQPAALPPAPPNTFNPPVILGPGAGLVLNRRGMTRLLLSPAGKP